MFPCDFSSVKQWLRGAKRLIITHILQYKRMETEMMKNRQDSFVTQIFFLPLSGMSGAMAFSTVFPVTSLRYARMSLEINSANLTESRGFLCGRTRGRFLVRTAIIEMWHGADDLENGVRLFSRTSRIATRCWADYKENGSNRKGCIGYI